ncbi:alpha-amylase [Pseudomassariella vexata]|uniref:Alpha-amylase n=1 Tax=Pseudomassariella vexata TaxID=1141098 RepID=A0A1Y2DB41_9PEZI|nr:alpha-amylase [Pseudomassariella vexata]ORY55885.1 alpha-amylase [Pseudomassariella vexata]
MAIPAKGPPPIPPRPPHFNSVPPPPPKNRTVLQGFEWYCPADHKHWQRLAHAIPNLARTGITSIWIPPACKAFWRGSTGYDIYDLYDLGEFDWKEAVHTKYGTKQELLHFVQVAEAHGVKVIFDAVVNHKGGADYAEPVRATRVDPEDRLVEISGLEDIRAWTGFNFPGRGENYSSFKWNKSHFSGVDYDDISKKTAVWKFEGKEWARDVDLAHGNYDYLMFANIDHTNEQVRAELFYWIYWLSTQLKLGGMRIDAVKHMSRRFVRDFMMHIQGIFGPDFYIVGDYWTDDSVLLAGLVDYMGGYMSLYDVQLMQNFKELSIAKEPDLRTVFHKSLVSLKPNNALTFVATHDSQEGQSCETLVDPWFIPLAYSLILLCANAGTPCVFWGDLYGLYGPKGNRKEGTFEPPAFHWPISRMIAARQHFAYGPQHAYFDDPTSIGFTRIGHPAHMRCAGLAVVMSASFQGGVKQMYVGRHHAHEQWVDLLRGAGGPVVIDANGWGLFPVAPRMVSVWVDIRALEASGMDQFVL